jgi:hypothetical protein
MIIKMKNIFKSITIILVFVFASCDLDGDLTNPNQISVAGADVDLIMNAVQLSFADFYNSASANVDQLVRMQAMTGGFRYQTAIQPVSVDNLWTQAYRNVLVNAEALIPLAQSKNLTTHVAVAKIIEAYVYLTLVDVFGDVPQAEAVSGASGNFNPVADKGDVVYAKAISLLTEARTELAKTGAAAGAALARDIYYSGNRTRWAALANTLELKAWMNIRTVAARRGEADGKITALLTTDLIDTEAENFTYKYGTATVPAGSRHPLYDQYYGPSRGQAGGYINNGYLYKCFGKWDAADPLNFTKAVQDPRWRYYFYRQIGSNAQGLVVDPQSLGCSPGAAPAVYQAGGFVFCQFDPGFYGRDHGDASGTPPDSPVITCAGAYPAGGKIDNTSTAQTSFATATIRGDGENGAGFQPIWMSFFTDYIKAEIRANAGDNAGAKTLLATAIANSVAQVKKSAKTTANQLSAGREPLIAPYQAAVATSFDNAARKLDVIADEYYIALWGNGVEAYNLYRRTLAPKGLQPTIGDGGPYFRSLVYPAVYANLNSNAVQKDVTKINKVFWDVNPDNAIN